MKDNLKIFHSRAGFEFTCIGKISYPETLGKMLPREIRSQTPVLAENKRQRERSVPTSFIYEYNKTHPEICEIIRTKEPFTAWLAIKDILLSQFWYSRSNKETQRTAGQKVLELRG